MSEVLKSETRVANMPQIRVVPKHNKVKKVHRRNNTEHHLQDRHGSFVTTTDLDRHNLSSFKKVDRKPKINYEQIMGKISKVLNGDDKVPLPKRFEGAKPDHKYERDQVAMRSLYNDIVKKAKHSVQYENFDQVTGQSN